MRKNEPIRMCIACRERELQKKLIRLQQNDNTVFPYTGLGRSFYLCKVCLDDEKKLAKALMRQCRTSDKNKLMIRLKEIITDDRKS